MRTSWYRYKDRKTRRCGNSEMLLTLLPWRKSGMTRVATCRGSGYERLEECRKKYLDGERDSGNRALRYWKVDQTETKPGGSYGCSNERGAECVAERGRTLFRLFRCEQYFERMQGHQRKKSALYTLHGNKRHPNFPVPCLIPSETCAIGTGLFFYIQPLGTHPASVDAGANRLPVL